MSIHFFRQCDAMDCGPTCLRMVVKYYGKNFNLETLRKLSHIKRTGASLLGLAKAAESIGFRTLSVKSSFNKLVNDAPLPAIVHWNQNHFVVVYKISGKKGNETVHVADPAAGLIKFPKDEFIKCWASTVENGVAKGIALLLEPTPEFYTARDEKSDRASFSFLFRYLRPFRSMVVQLFLGLLLGSMLQLLFPFLTQSIVDQGIGNRNLPFIYLVLIAQLVLTLSRVSVEFIRGWILLHLGTRINVSLISDFQGMQTVAEQ
ncbi:MAG: cysteine peptidase family C39 domain-containing protein [Salinivirgaceae bacterium]|nr:cysteine peptidase family C39 domain-containing protein [Salinivirgaceae bacterium]MDD2563547.1 cysteine peptidase family C39 domain-containing protein [Salinivirgaceae bacterium]